MTAKLNRRERKAQQLLAHYATCERLARHLGATDPDGKTISVELFKIEREAHAAMEHACSYPEPYITAHAAIRGITFDFAAREEVNEEYKSLISKQVARVFGKLPPGFFVNGDPRGYALKIDNETPEGKALIEAVKPHTDWGGYGILSPEITGD